MSADNVKEACACSSKRALSIPTMHWPTRWRCRVTSIAGRFRFGQGHRSMKKAKSRDYCGSLCGSARRMAWLLPKRRGRWPMSCATSATAKQLIDRAVELNPNLVRVGKQRLDQRLAWAARRCAGAPRSCTGGLIRCSPPSPRWTDGARPTFSWADTRKRWLSPNRCSSTARTRSPGLRIGAASAAFAGATMWHIGLAGHLHPSIRHSPSPASGGISRALSENRVC